MVRETIFYTKTVDKNGDDVYEPVKKFDSDLASSFPFGATMVVTDYHEKSYKYNVDPAKAEIVAGMMMLGDKLSDVVSAAAAYEPSSKILTKKQQLAWTGMKRAFEGLTSIQGKSAMEVANGILEMARKEIEEAMTNPAVKEAYDNFVFMAIISRKNK